MAICADVRPIVDQITALMTVPTAEQKALQLYDDVVATFQRQTYVVEERLISLVLELEKQGALFSCSENGVCFSNLQQYIAPAFETAVASCCRSRNA